MRNTKTTLEALVLLLLFSLTTTTHAAMSDSCKNDTLAMLANDTALSEAMTRVLISVNETSNYEEAATADDNSTDCTNGEDAGNANLTFSCDIPFVANGDTTDYYAACDKAGGVMYNNTLEVACDWFIVGEFGWNLTQIPTCVAAASCDVATLTPDDITTMNITIVEEMKGSMRVVNCQVDGSGAVSMRWTTWAAIIMATTMVLGSLFF